MATDQVKYSELLKNDSNNFQGLIDALENVRSKLAQLKQEGVNYHNSLKSANTATREQQQDMTKDAAAVERTRNEIKRLTDEEARLKAAIAEANRLAKLQAQAQNAAKGSLNEMRARYKLLVAEMGNYNLQTEQGRRRMRLTAAEARRLRDEIYKLETAYGQFGRNVGNYSGALARFGARLKEAAARFVAFNVAFLSFTGMTRFFRSVYDTRRELESALVTFKALAGEVQGANIFEQIKEFAFTTPVTLSAATKATQTMLSFGVAQEKVVDILKRLGDISAGDSDRLYRLALAYSQATQAGRLMGQDTLQFINSGFNPLYYISLRTGESMMELRKQMQAAKIPIEMVTQAIVDATSAGGQFNGMLDKQRETMKGASLIMEGAWQNMLNEMGKEMQDGIVGMLRWLTNLMKNWREVIKTLRQVVVSLGAARAAMLVYKNLIEAVIKVKQAEKVATIAGTAAQKAETAATWRDITAKRLWVITMDSVKKAIVGANAALKSFLPYAVIAGITMLVQRLIDSNREMRKLRDYTKEFAEVETETNRERRKELTLLDKLFDELKKAKKGTDDYKAAQQNIIDNFGQYNNTLNKELADVNNLKTAYDNLTQSINENYRQKARQSFMERSQTRLSESEVALREELNKFVEKYTDESGNWSQKLVRLIRKPESIYNEIEYFLQNGAWNNRGIASQIINKDFGRKLGNAAYRYQEALSSFRTANRRADALWGPYVAPAQSGYSALQTGGAGGDEASGRRTSGSFSNSYRGVTDADVLVERANAMPEQGDNALDEIEKWYEKRKAIIHAAYHKDLEMMAADKERREKSLEENLNNANIFKSKYDGILKQLDTDHLAGNISDEEYAAQKTKLEYQLNEATKLIKNEKDERENIAYYYRKKEAAIDLKFNNEWADLEKQYTEKKIEEEEKEFKAKQEIKKREFELTKHTAREERKFVMEQQMKFLDWRIKNAKALGISPELLKEMEEQYAEMSKMYDKGVYTTGQKNTYSSGMQVIADVLGYDLDKDKESALNSVFDQAKEALNSWMDARKEAADQAKELADDEVSAAENALNREIELRDQGYANNVALRERELADAKKMQKEAMAEQKKIARQQVLLDAALQTSSLITASANIIKQFAGQPALFLPMLGIMWGAFAFAKTKAYQAASRTTAFREGGVELLQGGSHESGHDINLGIGPDGSNLRAEGDEYFAVINKRNSRKYGNEIPRIVNALNAGVFEDKYIKTSDAVGLLPRIATDSNSGVDLGNVENGVNQLVRQGERTYATEGDYRVMRYKNLTRRVRIS